MWLSVCILKVLTYFEKIYLVVACNWSGMSGEDVKQGPAGRPELQDLPDSLTSDSAPSSGQTNTPLNFAKYLMEVFSSKKLIC